MNTFNQFDVSIFRDYKEAQHLHTDVELLYVVEGVLDIKIKDYNFKLAKDDILVINSSIQHSISSTGKNIVCSIKFDYSILVHVLKKPNSFFICNSAVEKGRDFTVLRKLCAEIMYHEAVSAKKTESYKYSLLYKLLDELIENYMVNDTNTEISENYDADEKLQIIIHYVHQNYKDGISLSDLAKKMYTSTSTLSRLFKKQTGTYFAEYVNQVRTRYAINELLYTEKNMTKIAMDCGFSNASAFTKVFREIYNMAPTEYRSKMKGLTEDKNAIDDEVKETIQERFKPTDAEAVASTSSVATVDVRHTTPLTRNWNKLLNVGFINDLHSANVQYHVAYLARELGFTYGRVWMVFNTKTMVSDGVTMGNFNFDAIFQSLDFLVKNRIKPWLDFTIRPYANVKNAEETVWFEDISIKFKNKDVWNSLFRSFCRALVRQYGLEEVSSWKFELGMESFHEAMDSYLIEENVTFNDAFTFFTKCLREEIPGAETVIAGAVPDLFDSKKEEQLKTLVDSGAKPDYISFMLFPYIPIMDAEQRKKDGAFVRTREQHFELHEIKKMRALLERVGMKPDQLVIGEWNVTVSNSNFLNDSGFRGAIFIRNIIEAGQDVPYWGMWMATDWLCNSYSANNVINGGGGILSKDTIRKPIYYAIRMLNHMGNEVVDRGDNYLVTKKGPDEYEIIVHNVEWYGESYYVDAENQSRIDECGNYFDETPPKKIVIELQGVSENSWYYLKKRSLNTKQGSIISEWGKFNFDNQLERADIKYLQEITIPGLSRTKVKSEKNVLRVEVEMEGCEFATIHVFAADRF